MFCSNDLTQQVNRLKNKVQQFSSKQSDVSGYGSIAAIKKADQQFTEARNLFYKLQWQGHGWFKEFGCRAVYNFAKDIDRAVSTLLSVWYWDAVNRSFVQDWVLSWTVFAEIRSKHQQMIQFQKELASAAALISAYKKKAANRVSDINTGEEKRKKSVVTSSLIRFFRLGVWVASALFMLYPGWVLSAVLMISVLEIAINIFCFSYGLGFVVGYILPAVISAFSKNVDKLLAGECLEILNDVRYDIITMVFLAYTAASLIRVTKYMADLPQKMLEGAKGIKGKVALKVNKIKEALSPTELDYSKLFRNIVSCLLFSALLQAPEMLLLGVPVINWTAWSIIACHQVASLLVQTVWEEIISRRGLVEQENTTVDKLIILVSSSVAFALAHLGNPEFAIIRSNPYAVFAMLGGYLAGGLVYGLVCIMSGGIELAWALHFANNFFIATIMGYTPSPFSHYPLYLTVHDESYGPTKYLLGLSSYGQALSYWGAVFYRELLMLVPVFVCESFARPRYDVESVCGYVSYGDMENEEKSQKEAKEKSETTEKVTSKPGMFESMWGRGMSRIFAF